jgi:uncharacterized membrane protein required for colicin V production
MALALTIGAVALVVLLAVLGLLRGVQRGLITVAGTLLGAVLVDLWLSTWLAWLVERLRPERPAQTAWLVATLGFVVVAVVVGYGSGWLIPEAKPAAEGKPRRHRLARPAGALLGALNGALIAAYLLRYASVLLGNDTEAMIQGSFALRLLSQWLPWFVLAVVLALATIVLARGLVRLLGFVRQRGAARPALAPTAAAAPAAAPASAPAAAPAAAQAPPAAASNTVVANAATPEAKLGAVSNKIDQKLGDKQG